MGLSQLRGSCGSCFRPLRRWSKLKRCAKGSNKYQWAVAKAVHSMRQGSCGHGAQTLRENLASVIVKNDRYQVLSWSLKAAKSSKSSAVALSVSVSEKRSQ